MTPSPRHAHRSGAISTSTMAAGRIRALTAARPITPTSLRCPSAWQLNLAEAPLIDAEKLFRQPGPRQRINEVVPKIAVETSVEPIHHFIDLRSLLEVGGVRWQLVYVGEALQNCR